MLPSFNQTQFEKDMNLLFQFWPEFVNIKSKQRFSQTCTGLRGANIGLAGNL